MSYEFGEFQRKAKALSIEHGKAVKESEERGETLARKEAEYHKQLAIKTEAKKGEHGATVAETLAKGTQEVREAKEARDIAQVRDRAGVARMRLAEADRAVLLTMGSWSKSQEKDW